MGLYAQIEAMDSVHLDVPRLALALVEAQVGSLVDVLPVAVLIADREGKVLRANEAAQQLLEQPTLLGCQVTDLLRAQHLEVRQRCLVQGDEVLRLYVIHSR
jgi:PAS domain-containing protein